MNALPTTQEIQPYVEQKLITKRHHPQFPELVIYNYTHKCAAERVWNNVTRHCRGLIINEKTGEVVARPFPKFFNKGEKECAVVGDNEQGIILEKYDGSLGILYFYAGQAWVATRGSFDSEQAQWATNWIRANHPNIADELSPNITFLFEIIYKENKIVVEYKEEKLVCIGAIDKNSGKNMDVIYRRGLKGFEVARMYGEMEKVRHNAEGYVVYYPTSNNWIKYKHENYLNIHRVMFNLTPKRIYEALKTNGHIDDILDAIPDEFHGEILDIANKILRKYVWVAHESRLIAEQVDGIDRKKQAEYLKEHHPEYMSIVFNRIDGKINSIEDEIWKIISKEVIKNEQE